MNNSKEILIDLKDVTVAYGKDVVLDKINLQIESHSFLPIVGPNGAGKTTLIKTILGLKKPLEGKITTPFKINPPGFVPQLKKIDLLYPVSVYEIVKMGFYPELGSWRSLTDAMKAKIEEVLKWLSLDKVKGKNFSELSGGMRQKVLIARALVRDPEVVIMDEPNTGLDEKSEKDLIDYLYRLWWGREKTVIFILHDTYLLRGYDFPHYISLNRGKITFKKGEELKL